MSISMFWYLQKTSYMLVSVSIYSIIDKKIQNTNQELFLLFPAKGAKRPSRGVETSREHDLWTSRERILQGRNVLGANWWRGETSINQ